MSGFVFKGGIVPKKELAREKTVLILKNSLSAVANSALSGCSLEYCVQPVWEKEIPIPHLKTGSYRYYGEDVLYNGMMIPQFLITIEFVLNDYAKGSVSFGYGMTKEQLLKIRSVENVREDERVFEFKRICELEGFAYSAFIERVAVAKKLYERLNELGKSSGFDAGGRINDFVSASYADFTLAAGSDSLQNYYLFYEEYTVSLTLTFKNHRAVRFSVPFIEYEKFLRGMEDFCKKLSGFEKLSESKIYALIESSSLRPYWVVTRPVIRRWIMESENHEIPFERLPPNLAENLFAKNESITSVVLPEGIKFLPDGLFKNCRNLERIRLPESLETIGQEAFFGCGGLREVNVPKNIRRIESQAFGLCYALKISGKIPETCEVQFGAFDVIGADEDTDFYEGNGYGRNPYNIDYSNPKNWY